MVPVELQGDQKLQNKLRPVPPIVSLTSLVS